MELEANNFEDADGKPINYINDTGYVADEPGKPPFLAIGLGVVTLGLVTFTLTKL